MSASLGVASALYGGWQLKSHEASSSLSHHHLRQLRTNSSFMNFRNPFSALKKKLKRQLAGGRNGPERPAANAGGERVDLTGSPAQQESHAETEDERGREVSGATEQGTEVSRAEGEGVDGKKVEEADPTLQPGLVPLLKSVAGGLTAALKHSDVWSISPTASIDGAHSCPSNRWEIPW